MPKLEEMLQSYLTFLTSYCPGPSDQPDCAILRNGQGVSNAFARRCTIVFAQRHRIIGARKLSAQQWRPVILKVLEVRRHVDGPNVDVLEARLTEKGAERIGLTDRNALACLRLQRCRSTPKSMSCILPA